MDPEYARRYRDLYLHHWWWRAREAVIVEQLQRRRPDGGFGAILDVGCGDALFFDGLREFGEPEGLESEAEIVSPAARERWRIHLGPFDESFDPPRRFGLVLMLDVLEHLDDDRAALEHVAHLLRPGGVLLLTVPAFRLLWTSHDDLNLHRTRYTRTRLVEVLGAAGFQVERARYFFHWLFPLKLLVRAKERLLGAEPELPGVPPAWINRAFYGAARLEHATWGRLPLPWGSSVLAVASVGEPAEAAA